MNKEEVALTVRFLKDYRIHRIQMNLGRVFPFDDEVKEKAVALHLTANMSQTEVADILGCSGNSMSKWTQEARDNEPMAYKAVSIANRINMEVKDLVSLVAAYEEENAKLKAVIKNSISSMIRLTK